MMWVLIAITIVSGSAYESYEVGRFDDMIECFYVREQAVASAGGVSGIPPINTQFICVNTEHK